MPKQSLGVSKAKKPSRPVGRPSDYSKEMADSICALIIDGNSLRKICSQEGFPSTVTVLSWLRTHEEFLTQYTRAREEQADSYVDEMEDIARSEADVNRARLIIDTRKWVAMKLKPKKYGEKLDVTSDGEKIVPIVNIGVNNTKRDIIEAEIVEEVPENAGLYEPDQKPNTIVDING